MVLYPIHFSIQISSNAQVEMSYGEMNSVMRSLIFKTMNFVSAILINAIKEYKSINVTLQETKLFPPLKQIFSPFI